jgi:hypothetical protein
LRVTSCDIHRVILVVFQNAGYQPIRWFNCHLFAQERSEEPYESF